MMKASSGIHILLSFLLSSVLAASVSDSGACPGSGRVSVRDTSDLLQWVKRGSPPLHCSYNGTGHRLQKSMFGRAPASGGPVVPLDDGFKYEFVDDPASGRQVLARSPRGAEDFRLAYDEIYNTLLPSAGVKVLSKLADNLEKSFRSDGAGFYGYDYLGGPYVSPTGTTAAEDLMFNVTLASTVMDILDAISSDLVGIMCSMDGFVLPQPPLNDDPLPQMANLSSYILVSDVNDSLHHGDVVAPSRPVFNPLPLGEQAKPRSAFDHIFA